MMFGSLLVVITIIQVTLANPFAEWIGSDVTKSSEKLDQELRDRLNVIEAELASIAKAVSDKADQDEAALQRAAIESGLGPAARKSLIAEEDIDDFEVEPLEAETEEDEHDLLNGNKQTTEKEAEEESKDVVVDKKTKEVPEDVKKKAAEKRKQKKKQKGLKAGDKKKKKKGKKSKKQKQKKGKKQKKKQKGLSAGNRKEHGLNQKQIDAICNRKIGLFNIVKDATESHQLSEQIAKLTDSFKLLKEAVSIVRPSVFPKSP